MPVTVTGVVPSVYVKLHGWLPVKAILICLDVPLHTAVAVVLITEVGRTFIFTVVLFVFGARHEGSVVYPTLTRE